MHVFILQLFSHGDKLPEKDCNEVVLPRSGLKIADRPDRTDFGPDQTIQAVCDPKTENHGPDRERTEGP